MEDGGASGKLETIWRAKIPGLVRVILFRLFKLSKRFQSDFSRDTIPRGPGLLRQDASKAVSNRI